MDQLDVGVRDELLRVSGEHQQGEVLHHASFRVNEPHVLRHIMLGQVLGVSLSVDALRYSLI